MDTPERGQIGTPIPKFEDSPVFNYINSLSPIEPVKSSHITHSFNSLNFTSPPSVFTSPHVTYARESRFLRRHCSPELSKLVSSENGPEQSTSVPISDSVRVSAPPVSSSESSGQGISIREVTVDHASESPELAIELPRTLKYDCGSPDGDQAPVDSNKVVAVSITSGSPERLVQFVQEENSMEVHHSFESGTGLSTSCQIEHTKEEIGCDWENLIPDATDLLVFDSPDNIAAQKPQDQKLVALQTSFTSLVAELAPDGVENSQRVQPLTQVASHEQHETEKISTQTGEVSKKNETDHTPQLLSGDFQNQQSGSLAGEKMNDKAESSIPFGCKLRGIRRRCLVFESGNAQKKKLEDDSNSCSSFSSHSEEKAASDGKPLAPVRPGSSPCILPGIGLHLNALAASTKDLAVVKHEAVIAGKQLISMPCSSSTFHSLSSEGRTFKPLALSSIKTDADPGSNFQVPSDVSRASAFKASDEGNESSPKKKRRRMEQAGEGEGCKRCNCKKSKCLKLYCECFAAGVYCVEPCSCQECFNKPIHEDTVLATRKQIESRNPLAFAPKVIRSSESNADIGEDSNKTPASARHKRGCNCKKSSCLKKYCECYQGGVGCSVNCRCEGCKNGFGRKDGSTPLINEEIEVEEDDMETFGKNAAEKRAQNNEAYKSEEHNEASKSEEQYPDLVVPVTFSFQICRTSIQLPFSIGKPPQSPLPPQRRFEKHFQVIPDDETPEILKTCSPISGVKTSSPNCKRISPPHNAFISSPGRRSSRKLILRSIPAFPSLNEHDTGDLQ